MTEVKVLSRNWSIAANGAIFAIALWFFQQANERTYMEIQTIREDVAALSVQIVSDRFTKSDWERESKKIDDERVRMWQRINQIEERLNAPN